MRCCPNLSMIRADLQGLKETVKIIKGLILPFQAAGIKQSNCLRSFLQKVPPGSPRHCCYTFPKMITSWKEWWKRLLSKAKKITHNFLKPSLVILAGLQNSREFNFSLPFSFVPHCKHLGHMFIEKHK